MPAHLIADAAALFEAAFADKLRSSLPDSASMAAALELSFRPDHIVAAIEEETLVGMVGLSAAAGPYRGGVIKGTEAFGPLRELLGLVGAARAVVGLAMGQHRPEPGELYVDGIAVDGSMRGRGIGTKLLAEVRSIAGEDGFRWVRLDVVDTNPRAQQLYQRLGFRVTNVETFGYLRRFIGYGGMISMELEIERATVGDGGPS